jgi:hypothetical protein
MPPITWENYDHPHEEKSPEWYVLKWIIAGAAALVCIIFGNILFGILILVAAGTLSLLAARPVPMKTYTVDERGVTINTELFKYSEVLSHEFVDRGHDHLLVVDTKHALNPHLLISIPDEHIDDVRALFAEHAKDVPTHTRGIPLSHTLMELIGL